MRCGTGLALLLLAGCALPPRIDDQKSPVSAYETFRGALARGEFEREYACMSDDLRARLGATSPTRWKDARVLFLKQDDSVIRSIAGSEALGEPEFEADGRARLRLRLKVSVFGKDATLWLSPVPVVRVYIEGDDHPILDQILPEFTLVRDEAGVIGVRVPPEVLDALELGPAERPRRLEAGIEWFLDDFDVGGKTPRSVAKEMENEE